MECYDLAPKVVFNKLGSKESGLSNSEVKSRIEKYGKNEIERQKHDSLLHIFVTQFKSPIVWVLLVAVFISAGLGDMIDAAIIGIILMLNAVIGTSQEYRAEKSIEALQKLSSLKAVVIRDGKEHKIDAAELVPGDVIVLETGEKVPADARVFELAALQTLESALTGESTTVNKKTVALKGELGVADRKNMIFSGTVITKGRGKAVVTATGMNTEMGKIAEMIQKTEKNMTPLQNQLAKLGKWLGIVTVVVCILVFFTNLLLQKGDLLTLFFTAVALAVAAIPEGLPAVVTISLALGVQRMVKRNALMRHLPSVETLGCTTAICSDKTGTLTHNEMTVKNIFIDNKDVTVSGSGYRPEGGFSTNKDNLKMILTIGALNNDAHLDREGWKVIGDPTEGALLTSAMKAGLDKKTLETMYPRVDEIPFDSERKRMTTVHKIAKKRVAYVKGAVDVLLDRCDYIFVNSQKMRLSSKMKKDILKMNEAYSDKALRVLGFAYKELDTKDKQKDYETGLIFVGLQAMMDPPRKEVKAALKRCKSAGIKVFMITGDHKATAIAVAREVGLDGGALVGVELDKLSDDDLKHRLDKTTIFSRVNPAHKSRIVTLLKEMGHVVAVTGDGVNDAPALKKADIGISMGITGTDVAKEASEMILTDDNFASIVNAVEEGRGIYDNIRKFVNYLLSCNVGEVLIIFFAALMGLPLPLLAIHLLWVNLLTDGLPAVALGIDPVAKDAMKRPPRKVSARILSRGMTWNIGVIAVLICIATLFGFMYGNKVSVELGRTIAFTMLVALEIVRIYMIRYPYKLSFFSNKWLLGAIASSIMLQMIVIYSPLNKLFHTIPLGINSWFMIIILSVSVFIAGMMASRVLHKYTQEMV